jgi:hypothetical protein
MATRIPLHRSSTPLLLALVLLGADVVEGAPQRATLRFQPTLYRVAENASDLRVTLAIDPPPCSGAVEVLESTARIQATGGGTATPGVDFVARNEAVPLGGSRLKLSHRLDGLILDDTVQEGRENFFLTLSLSAGAHVRCTADGQLYPLTLTAAPMATVEIEDDDAQPLLRVEGPGPTPEGDEGTTDASFRVSLSRPSFNAVSVEVATDGCRRPGSATPGTDYTPVHQRLTFLYPETEMRVAVRVHGDLIFESDETFPVCLRQQQGAGIAPGGAEALGVIQDDDDQGRLRLEAVEGDGQSGPPGQELPHRLYVKATKTDSRGVEREVAEVPIEWVADSGATFPEMTKSTDATGRAWARVTLGKQLGGVKVAATTPGSDAATFHLKVVPNGCEHPELLSPEQRAHCGGNPPGDQVVVEVPAQVDLGREGLELQRRLVQERLDNRGKRGGGGATPRRTGPYGGAGTSSGSRPTSEREAGYDYALHGFAAGIDGELPGGLLLGGAVGYVGGGADYLGGGGSLDLRALCVSAYAAYRSPSDAYHLQGIFILGRPRFAMERVVVLPNGEPQTAKSTPEGAMWDLSLGGGATANVGQLELEGFGNAHWLEVQIDPYGERGAGDLDLVLSGQRQRSLVFEAGLRVLYEKTYEHWGLALHLGGSALHELADDSRRIEWRLAQGPDAEQRFFATTDRPDRDYFNLEGGVVAKLPGPWSTYLSFRKEMEREDLKNRSLLFGVLVQF